MSRILIQGLNCRSVFCHDECGSLEVMMKSRFFLLQLPNKETWNGIITRFVLRYWTVNSSMAESDTGRLEVFGNVSNTTGTLTNLYLNETYAVTVQMCTRVGCGPASQLSYILEMNVPGLFCFSFSFAPVPWRLSPLRFCFCYVLRNIPEFLRICRLSDPPPPQY